MNTPFLYLSVDQTVISHPIEKRGFVSVPLDYEKPDQEKISIFYRLIPAYGSSPNDHSKPVVVVFNGGPGIPSSFYRPLDFDYQNPKSEKNGSFDRFLYLLKDHHVLIADQRGTLGQSAPLNLEDPDLDAHAIAKYFSSDNQARDYLKVIETVIPKEQPFFIIAQSYGGMVGMQYLSLESARVPKKLFFTCSALPYEDIQDANVTRRKEQKKLNQELVDAFPESIEKIKKLRLHLQSHQIDADNVHHLFTWLGKSEKGTWEKKLMGYIDSLLSKNEAELRKIFLGESDQNILNYILSSANFTPGFTDRTLAQMTAKEVPYEDWMIDENWVLIQTGKGHPVADKVLTKLDANPPEPTPFLSIPKIRSCLERFHSVFVSADNDAFVPEAAYRRAYEKFWVEGKTSSAHIPGGHHAIFLEAGISLLK